MALNPHFLSNQALISDFNGKKIKEWNSQFQSFCLLATFGTTMSADYFGTLFLSVHSTQNKLLHEQFTKFKRLTGITGTIPLTVNLAPFMDQLTEKFSLNNAVKKNEVFSRIQNFKFSGMSQKTIDAFDKLLEEYRSLNNGEDVSQDVLCQAYHTGVPKEIARTLISNQAFNPESAAEWHEQITNLCIRNDAYEKRVSLQYQPRNHHPGDVEMNPFSEGRKQAKNKQDKQSAKNSERKIPKQVPHKPAPQQKACNHCGKDFHKKREDCPAFGKTCSKCGRQNHFSTVCRSSAAPSSVNYVREDEDDSQVEFYQFLFETEKRTNPASFYRAEVATADKPVQGSVTCKALADTGCDSALLPYELRSYLKNPVSRVSTFNTATAVESLQNQTGELSIIVADTENKQALITFTATTMKNVTKFLLPAPLIDTFNKFMVMDGVKVPITRAGNLWEVQLTLIPPSPNLYRSIGPTTKTQLSIPDLNKLGIFPIDAVGTPLNKDSINELLGLFLQVMHVRTGHHGPRVLQRFFTQYFHCEIPVSHITAVTAPCKVCKTKVTYHKPSTNAQKTRKRTNRPNESQATPNKDFDADTESSSASSSECDSPIVNSQRFNHRLFQDCIKLPPSLKNKNTNCSVIVDAASGFVSVYGSLTPTSSATAQHLVSWIDLFGQPFSVQTDNGPEFSGSYSDLLTSRVILHRQGIPYRPQQQGKVERTNRELKALTSRLLRSHDLPDACWEWCIEGAVNIINKLPKTDGSIPYQQAKGRLPKVNLWPGDRVCFKPRTDSDKLIDPTSIKKLLVGRFQGNQPGKKALVSIFSPDAYNFCIVPKEEINQLPLSLSDCVDLVKEGFDEPANVDLATRLASVGSVRIKLSQKKFAEIAYVFNMKAQGELLLASKADIVSTTSGKTHLEVTKSDLNSGSHKAAIEKEFASFIKNKVFGNEISRDEAKALKYEIVSFKGVPSWKLKPEGRIPKWRGVCRGFQDKRNGEVDTDAPSTSLIRLCFLVGASRRFQCALSDAVTAFLQVECPKDRKVAVQMGDYVPETLSSRFRAGGLYPLLKMLYGLKDSPRQWVLFLRKHLLVLGWTHIGSGIYTNAKGHFILAFYDDIACFSENPLSDLRALSKTVELEDPTPFSPGDSVRFIGPTVRCTTEGYSFSIADYCTSLTSSCTKTSLSINRQNLSTLKKIEGDANRTYLKDVGALGWISSHHHSVAFPFSFFSRYSQGDNQNAHRLVKAFIDKLRNSPPEPYSIHPINLADAHLLVFTDASIDKDSGDSQLGVYIQLSDSSTYTTHKNVENTDNTILFKSKKNQRVVRASGQAELAALSLGIDLTLDLKHTLDTLNVSVTLIEFFVDAKVVLDQLRNPEKAEPHSRLQVRFLAQALLDLKAKVTKVKTEDQKADPLTHFFK